MRNLINEILTYRPLTMVGLQAVCVIIDGEKRANKKEEHFNCDDCWGLDCGLGDMVGLSLKTEEIYAKSIHTDSGTYMIYSGPENELGYPPNDKEIRRVLKLLDGYGERAIIEIAEKVYSEYQKTLPKLSEIRGILKD